MAKITNMIKVTFLLKDGAPLNLKEITHYVMTDDYNHAHQEATEILTEDAGRFAAKFNIEREDLLSYYNRVVMADIPIIW